jgi:hypothetical protein
MVTAARTRAAIIFPSEDPFTAADVLRIKITTERARMQVLIKKVTTRKDPSGIASLAFFIKDSFHYLTRLTY